MRDRTSYYTVSHSSEFTLNWAAFYDRAEEMTEQARKSIRNQLDISYLNNDNPEQKLDVYYSEGSSPSAPVFIFIHGGGFREGDKDDYGFVAPSFLANGVITVVPNYRWAPLHKYPAQVEDTRNVVEWVYKNISRFHGDPNQIFIGGHSAGAILSSAVAVNSEWTKSMGLPSDVVKGYVPISGSYDFRKRIGDVYLADQSQAVEASPMLNIVDPPRTIIAVGSEEKESIESSKEFANKLAEKGKSSELLILDGMNHADTVMTLKDRDGKLVKAIIRIITQK